jgi:tellurite resistance protein TehA-like permease
MGTGIVSIGLSLDGHETLSRVLLAIAAAIWIGLGALLTARVAGERAAVLLEATVPAALTGVAGTDVLGARFAMLGWDRVAAVLLAIALCLWLLLVPRVLRHWRTPTIGASFVLVVSTESLAVLAAVLSLSERAEWLAVGALAGLVLGLVAYVFVLVRFDFRQLVTGHGDHWVAGGALAIATLACGKVALAAQGFSSLRGIEGTVSAGALVLWVLAIVWLPPLVVCELIAPRLAYDVRRWSTVFPVGMYAACSFAVGGLRSLTGLVDFARIWIWVAAALWAVVFSALLYRGLALWRSVAAGPVADRPAGNA